MKNDVTNIGNNTGNGGVFQQFIGFEQGNGSSFGGYQPGNSCSSEDGTYIYMLVDDGDFGSNKYIYTFERDQNTGIYNLKGSVICSIGNIDQAGICLIGGFVYTIYDGGTNVSSSRYTIGIDGTLSSETIMTVPVVTAPSISHFFAWTNGTDLYLTNDQTTTVVTRWTISGTTFSAGGTSTCVSQLVPDNDETFNGYATTTTSGGEIFIMRTGADSGIYKLGDAFGTSVTSQALPTLTFPISDGYQNPINSCCGVFAIVANSVCYYGYRRGFGNGSGDTAYSIVLQPITLSL